MLARDAVEPRLRRVLWIGYAPSDVHALIAEVRHSADRAENARDEWSPLDRSTISSRPVSTSWFGYARADVELWRAAVEGRVGPPPLRRVATRIGTVAAVTLSLAAIVGAISPAALAIALAAYLVVVLPPLGVRNYRATQYRLRVAPRQRAQYLATRAVSAWLLVGVVAILGATSGRGLRAIYLTTPHFGSTATFLFIEAVVLIVVSIVVLSRMGRRPTPDRVLTRQVGRVVTLLPRTRSERVAFAGLSVTAGVVEEILYRGFGIAALREAFPHVTTVELVVATAVVFGAAHLYQKLLGVIGTGIIGVFLAWLTIATGSIVPAMIVHTLIDLRICFIPTSVVTGAEVATPAR